MPYQIWNRRYTGSKYKLADWICGVIDEKCEGKVFCDIFGGTGVLTQRMLDRMDKIIVNDLLFSNEIVYKAFFIQDSFDIVKLESYKEKFKAFNGSLFKNNYVSENFGDKFFSMNDALIIGEIREQIEQLHDITEKEKCILIASLLYSVDKIANTVGHYEAYIKGHELRDRFQFDLITPYKTNSDIDIYREDANDLAEALSCDIVYIDPPYNSRQYSRFYHVLENIATWKKPELFGVALKPKPENMSDYCRNNAIDAFTDLIEKLNCKYILVSYNNTYNSKSSSSKNKMALENIEAVLKSKGSVECFEKSHQFFNAGKTDLKDHKELLYLVEVDNER
ncbi:MAG: DNA adenine methylase [Bacillota bacterium]